jgi:hypothetical protein
MFAPLVCRSNRPVARPPLFRPTLVELESRNLLSGGSFTNLPADVGTYLKDAPLAVLQIVAGNIEAGVGVVEKAIGVSGGQALQDQGNALASTGRATLDRDKANITSDLDLVDNVLTANGSKAPNDFTRYSNDTGFLLEGGFLYVFGAVAGSKDIKDTASRLMSGAVSDITTGIKQEIQSLFNLSSSQPPSAAQQFTTDGDESYPGGPDSDGDSDATGAGVVA